MHVAAARLTPASLTAAATRASAPGSFWISMTRSYGIAPHYELAARLLHRMREFELPVIRPIGVVRSGLRDRSAAPNQAGGAPEALLEIDPEFADALHRVEDGDELILLTWLHLADRECLQTHPMGDESIPLSGVFRT